MDLIKQAINSSHKDKLQECIPVGCVASAAVAMSIPQHALGRGCQSRVGAVSAHGGGGSVCPGVCVCIPACTEADTPCEQND